MVQPGHPSDLILVVDDDEISLRITSRVLEQRGGFRVISLSKAFGLSSEILTALPAAVVLDVSMPGLDGPAVWRIARTAIGPPPQVLFFSSLDQDKLAKIASEFPEASFLTKPATSEVLVREVRSAVRRRAALGRESVPRDPRDRT